jgi:hypothetical protein
MRIGRIALRASLAASILAAGSARAESEPPVASVYAGAELSTSDSRRLEAGATARPGDFAASVSVVRANFDSVGEDAASAVDSVKASYQFGRFDAGVFGAGAGLRRAEIDDLSVTRGWLVSGYFESGSWTVSGDIEFRGTQLAATAFSDEDIPGIGRASGVARCEVDSTGYGAQAAFARARWSGFAGLSWFDYDEYDCELTIDDSVVRLPRGRGVGLANRLAGNTLRPVSGFGPRLLPREATLLESTVSAGATYSLDERWLAGVELYRDVDRLSGDDYLTALVFANRRLNAVLSLEVWAGHATALLEDDAEFLGARITADL